MFANFNLDRFIAEKITKRPTSLLAADLDHFQAALAAKIDGKSVLVIGGAGTIGSHYIKALLRFRPARLVVCDTDENSLTELVRDLRSDGTYYMPKNFTTYPVDFGTPVFEKLFAAYSPFHIVANFAAHKHVRSEKDLFSIEAMFENNVLCAHRLLALLDTHRPEHFFCVSTDKAANPVNIMGASKKLMEDLIFAYADRFPVKTARFANVAFSNGSLPRGFLERLTKRQPWSCPRDIRRFFVSPIESGELCLLASLLASTGDIVFPKLDADRDMIPFENVVADLLEALGLEPDPCSTEDEAHAKMKTFLDTTSPRKYPVLYFDSDTSGEKSFEEFYIPGETLDLDHFANLGIIKNTPRKNLATLTAALDEFANIFANPHAQKHDLVALLACLIPNFDHIEKGKHLDQRM